MTCIVGWINDDRVLIGGDSAGVDASYALAVRKDPKVFTTNGIAIGFASSYRMGQILQAHLTVKPTREKDEFAWMLDTFIPEVRRLFKDGVYMKKENEVESGGFFLVGLHNRLFKIEADYQVSESAMPFESCGCGEAAALGAMSALLNDPRTVREKLLETLRIAEGLSGGVRNPFHIVESTP